MRRSHHPAFKRPTDEILGAGLDRLYRRRSCHRDACEHHHQRRVGLYPDGAPASGSQALGSCAGRPPQAPPENLAQLRPIAEPDRFHRRVRAHAFTTSLAIRGPTAAPRRRPVRSKASPGGESGPATPSTGTSKPMPAVRSRRWRAPRQPTLARADPQPRVHGHVPGMKRHVKHSEGQEVAARNTTERMGDLPFKHSVGAEGVQLLGRRGDPGTESIIGQLRRRLDLVHGLGCAQSAHNPTRNGCLHTTGPSGTEHPTPNTVSIEPNRMGRQNEALPTPRRA